MSSDQLKKLYTQLCAFGLNSKEWIIFPLSGNECLISYGDDPTFRFKGLVENHGWTEIWLESI